MKVDVIQVKEAKFRHRWSWWSTWIDVAIFDYSYQSFLIQMRVSRTNAKSFKSICITGLRYRQISSHEIGDLTQMQKVPSR